MRLSSSRNYRILAKDMQSSCPCAHVWSERLAFSCGLSPGLRACPRQARDRYSAQVLAFAKSSKRLKYSHSSDKQTRGEPLFVRVEPDGSDIWRLDAIISLLKSGAVSRCTANSCVFWCLPLSAGIVAAPFWTVFSAYCCPISSPSHVLLFCSGGYCSHRFLPSNCL